MPIRSNIEEPALTKFNSSKAIIFKTKYINTGRNREKSILFFKNIFLSHKEIINK